MKIKKTITVDQWLELIEDHLKQRITTNKKVKIVGISCEPVVPWSQSITLMFNTYTHSAETGLKIPSTLSISGGDVDSSEAFSSLVEEIFDRWENQWH